jgi:hypothetical protein
MIHHVSIPAREPQRVAEVLAELMNGKCLPFRPLEGAFMAASGDANGTMIEVYPERATLNIPDPDGQVAFGENPAPPQTWPFHLLLSVSCEAEEVKRIGAREGWRAKTFGRGIQGHKPFFHVVEFWLENRLMIEVATPAMAQAYLDFLKGAQTATASDSSLGQQPLWRNANMPRREPNGDIELLRRIYDHFNAPRRMRSVRDRLRLGDEAAAHREDSC